MGKEKESGSIWKTLLILTFVSIPILPKVKVISLGAAPILLDDFMLLCGTSGMLFYALWSAAVRGHFPVKFSVASQGLAAFLTYKVVGLFTLALALPIISHVGYMGHGVLLSEGLLVIVKLCILGCVYYIIYNLIDSERDISLVVSYQLLCLTIAVVIGLLQVVVLGHNVISSTFKNIYSIQTNYHVFFIGDPWFAETAVGHEHFGAFLVLSIPFILAMLVYRWPRGKKNSLGLIALLIGSLICLVFASSRGAWIGAIFMVLAFFWCVLQTGSGGRFLRMALIGLVVLMCLEVGEYTHFSVIVEKRISLLLTVFDDKILDDSASHRLHLARVLWGYFLDFPVFGLGAGAAGRIAEGQYLRELVEGGIIGAFLFLMLVYKCLKVAKPFFQKSVYHFEQAISIGFFCGFIGLLGQFFFTELFILTKVSVPFWIWAAVAHKTIALRLGQADS